MSLPVELMMEVFSFLEPYDMLNCMLVNKEWCDIVHDDSTWRISFQREFGMAQLTRLSPLKSWRSEYFARIALLRKYRKGGLTNLSFATGLRSQCIDMLCADFEANRSFAYCKHIGVGVVADHTKGRTSAKPFYSARESAESADYICSAGSRYGVAFGSVSGAVSMILLSHKARLQDYVAFKDVHPSPVTAIWMTPSSFKARSSSQNGDKALAISADLSGNVFLWDNLSSGRSRKQWRIVQPILDDEEESQDRSHPPAVFQERPVHIEVFGANDSVCVVLSNGFVFVSPDQSRTANLKFLHCTKNLNFWPETAHVTVSDSSSYLVLLGEQQGVRIDLLNDTVQTFYNHCFANCANVDAQEYKSYVTAVINGEIKIWRIESKAVDDETGLLVPSMSFLLNEHYVATAIAMNSVAVFVAAISISADSKTSKKDKSVFVHDALNGDFLRVVSARFSKRSLNYRGHAQEEFPISQICLDPNPANIHGIAVSGSALQYFNVGHDTSSEQKKKGIGKRKMLYAFQGSNGGGYSKLDIEKDIESDLKQLETEREEKYKVDEIVEQHMIGDMTEEEQLAMALSLSNEGDVSRPPDDSDSEMERAISLSLSENKRLHHSNESENIYSDFAYSEDDDEGYKEVEKAISLSLTETNVQSQSLQPTDGGHDIGCSSASGGPKDWELMTDEEQLEFILRRSTLEQ